MAILTKSRIYFFMTGVEEGIIGHGVLSEVLYY